jgi:pimeloyl-ACP methyl ester carboxylesterase
MCEMLLPLKLDTVTPDYIPWLRGESLSEYAKRFADELLKHASVTAEGFAFVIGISMGGPIAIEMSRLLPAPSGVILIGSFTSVAELAPFVRLFLPIASWLPDWVVRAAGRVLPFFMRRISRVPEADLMLLQDMYMNMPAHFFQRACAALCSWRSPGTHDQCVRIHGIDDHIIPISRSDKIDFPVKGAKHLVTFSHPDHVRSIVEAVIDERPLASRMP